MIARNGLGVARKGWEIWAWMFERCVWVSWTFVPAPRNLETGDQSSSAHLEWPDIFLLPVK